MPHEPRDESPAAPRLILASSSPRRQALMREYGFEVRVIAPELDEPDLTSRNLSPAQQAEALSYFKAGCVARLIDRGTVIGGDTIAALEGQIFGKPTDRDDARRTLARLAGTTHQVITGVTLLDAARGTRLIQHDTTNVTMRPLADAELEAYLDTGAWQGKAGAYGIQDRGDAFVERIEGSFTNVVGFPMELLGRMLQAWGEGAHDLDADPTAS